MKARTLFFVIMFSSIYKQRHIFTRFITDNGFLQNDAKAIVKDDHDFTGLVAEAVQKKITAIIATASTTFRFHTFQNNQKLTPITTGTELKYPLTSNSSAGISKEVFVETTPIKNFI